MAAEFVDLYSAAGRFGGRPEDWAPARAAGQIWMADQVKTFSAGEHSYTRDLPAKRSYRYHGRILVVDDDEPTRYIFRQILSQAGFQVEEADSGADALRKASGLPDLIIADVHLPDMLGYDLSRQLKGSPTTAQIPILQTSASFISEESRVMALSGGADSYLIHPVDPTVLISQVQALLRLRKAEALSNLSAKQWQTTFDALSDGLALVDSDGCIMRANRAFHGLLKLEEAEADSKPIAVIFQKVFSFSFADFLKLQALDQAPELCFGSRWFRVRYDAIQAESMSEADEGSGSILLLTDVTYWRKLQESLKVTEQLAATGRLAHVMAHEINNPLEALSNLLYLINQNSAMDEMNQNFMHQAMSELERIGEITKQILVYHRESKQPASAHGAGLLEGVLAMYRPQMMMHRVKLESEFSATRMVFVHPGEMRQAFGNLLSNALDAMGERGGTIRVRCFDAVDWKTGRRGVRFVLSDDGPGIAEESLPHIFDAFYTTKELKGSGIGLWLTSEVIAKHQGHIRVRSRTKGAHQGALFDIFLPEYDATPQFAR